jgi:hydrogenase nickel insertion protein HypA
MHEAAIVQDLLERVGAIAHLQGAIAVHRIGLRLGELCGVEPELLGSAYEALRVGTGCACAPLEVARVPARWECAPCGKTLERGARLSCPDCGRPARLAEGDEIFLERVEMEVP